MKDNNFNITRQLERIKKFVLSILNWLGSRSPIIGGFLVALVVMVLLVRFALGLIADYKGAVQPSGEKVLKSETADPPMLEGLNADKWEKRCKGEKFEIFSKYFEPVGNERFFGEKEGASARNTDYYQATLKSNWACNIPFVTQIVAIPLSGPSFGLFFEYEDAFRVLVGDGDRVTLKVEQNKLNDRKREWQTVPDKGGNERQRLGNPIEDGEEVTLIIEAKESGGNIVLHIDVYHSKFQSVEKFDYVFSPNAINIQAPQPRNFRVGLNDFRFKGTGSVIDLKTLSIEEKKW